MLFSPLQGEKLNSSSVCEINFLQCEQSKNIDEQVNKLWYLDSLRTRLKDDGERYSVSLFWKAGHGSLPSNLYHCFVRMVMDPCL